ncbi:MAG: hypothetical protein HOY69_24590 [Streptomyces sp.]|nr:hypothetical protein [Streptomyces sp.]
MTTQPTIEQRVADRFKLDVAKHKLTVLHEDGLYRHLRARTPKTNAYWFDITTWPGTLTITGDMGAFVFSREPDMLPLFRSDHGRINPHYWAQKEQTGAPTKTYSEDVFRQVVWGDIREYGHEYRGLAKAIQAEIFDTGASQDEQTARDALEHFEHAGFTFTDVWEMSFSEYSYHYLWCCHAIVWGIAAYDRATVEKPAPVLVAAATAEVGA